MFFRARVCKVGPDRMPLCSPSVRRAVARLRIQSPAQRNQLAFWRLAQTSQTKMNSPPQPTSLLFEKLFDAAGERQGKAFQVMVFVDVRLAFLQPLDKHLVVRLLVATDPFDRLLSEVLAIDSLHLRFLKRMLKRCSNHAQTHSDHFWRLIFCI